MHGGGKGQVTPVGQHGHHQTAVVALVFEAISVDRVGLQDLAVEGVSLRLLDELELFLPLEVVDAGASLLQLVNDVPVVHLDGDQGKGPVLVQPVLVVQPDEVGQLFNKAVLVIPNRFPLLVLVLLVIISNIVEHPGTVISPDNLTGSDGQLAQIVLHPGMAPLNTLALLHSLEGVGQQETKTFPHLTFYHPHPILDSSFT